MRRCSPDDNEVGPTTRAGKRFGARKALAATVLLAVAWGCAGVARLAPGAAEQEAAADTAIPGYAEDELTLFDGVNEVRTQARAGRLVPNEALDTAAQAHLAYLRVHFPYFGHDQRPGSSGFTGLDAGARARAAGYRGRVGEVAARSSSSDPADCLALLVNSVYHQAALFAGYRDVGIAFGAIGPATYACVLEVGLASPASGQQPASVLVYPAEGTTGVPQRFTPGLEVPNPLPDFGLLQSGPPVLVSMNVKGSDARLGFEVHRFELLDEQGSLVPSRLLANCATRPSPGTDVHCDETGLLRPGETYLVPLAPLLPGSRYRLRFEGVNGPLVHRKAWQFETAA